MLLACFILDAIICVASYFYIFRTDLSAMWFIIISMIVSLIGTVSLLIMQHIYIDLGLLAQVPTKDHPMYKLLAAIQSDEATSEGFNEVFHLINTPNVFLNIVRGATMGSQFGLIVLYYIKGHFIFMASFVILEALKMTVTDLRKRINQLYKGRDPNAILLNK